MSVSMSMDDLRALRYYDPSIPKFTPNQKRILYPMFKDFELIEIKGRKFSDLIKCRQRFTGQLVALKILTIPENEKKNGVPHSILNHISIVRYLNHPNIVRLLQVIGTEDDVFLTFEYLNDSLKRYLFNPLLFGVKKVMQRSLLRRALSGLAYCHSQNILHRNLSPYNISIQYCEDAVLNEVKLTDFTAAITMEPPLPPYSINIGYPRYKAPEILLGSTNYSTAVDIWSMGCIFAEIFIGKPLFHGKDAPKILAQIFCLLGTPTEETWPGVSSICNFVEAFDPPTKPKDLALKFPGIDPAGVDLVSKMLCLCPNSRISAQEAVNHPYLRP
ncbi:cell division control protein 2 homolog [Cicer arietinum]|uniref:cyclin-dependent kinase n=1 Tax=Cicer arietinum TaxID=3827 RepID=A0A1S2Z7J6_CICAR|nr:cell division control protein 2 homolog [Cicer arietinum]